MEIFEPWSPEKGLHKKIKYKANVYLEKSPMFFLKELSRYKNNNQKEEFLEHYPNLDLPNSFHYFEFNEDSFVQDSFDSYINIQERRSLSCKFKHLYKFSSYFNLPYTKVYGY